MSKTSSSAGSTLTPGWPGIMQSIDPINSIHYYSPKARILGSWLDRVQGVPVSGGGSSIPKKIEGIQNKCARLFPRRRGV